MSMIAIAFAMCILAAITVCRALVVKSESECFGSLWTRAILSEYDTNLLNDYGIMAYQGSERDVNRKLDYYAKFSFGGKLDASIGNASSSLGKYALSNPENFGEAIKLSLIEGTLDGVINNERMKRNTQAAEDGADGDRYIKNEFVIDTLPSAGISNEVDAEEIAKTIKENGDSESIGSVTGKYASEFAFVKLKLGNHLYAANNNPTFFQNEWEYIIEGEMSDEKNLSGCKRKLFVIRNVLNLAALLKDSEKMTAITSIAELITPGPGALITQAVITEAWAAAEANEDVKCLLDGGRVPLIKSQADWQVGLGSIIKSDDVIGKLDEEGKKLFDENLDQINETADSIGHGDGGITKGLNYEDYLMILMVPMNDNVRILRIMDIVQINMKYRYYRDFNMEEYYVGTDIAIETNGRTYDAEGIYR